MAAQIRWPARPESLQLRMRQTKAGTPASGHLLPSSPLRISIRLPPSRAQQSRAQQSRAQQNRRGRYISHFPFPLEAIATVLSGALRSEHRNRIDR